MNTYQFLRVVLAVGLSAHAFAEGDLPPALKTFADKFEFDRKVIADGAEVQLKPARDRYLAVLAAAQKTATAAAKTGDIAAIASEIESVNSGNFTPEAAPDLPKTLTTERRAYGAIAANLARNNPPRVRDLAARYLQTLAALDANALKAHDAAMADAIAQEKRRVLALLEAAGGTQKNRNLIANGDFSKGEPNGWPPDWKKEADDVTVSDTTIMTEGNDKFLRVRRLQAMHRSNLLPEKDIVIPARAKYAEFSFRMRAKGVVPGHDYDTLPGVHVTGRDARGEEVSSGWGTTKQDTGWKRFTGRTEIVPTAKTLRVAVGAFGAAGIIDFDDITVEFR